ncbi:hypothetical protein EHQ92_12775 [Leptospira biflexa]|uniref:hypothetical protein n=1 Tax=Leptospira biflexa TaxID=172 RepID=UPI0010915E3C|nr:hypothetical protein [Leptospira biflexa]TGM45129.1 hypothetical protein EHQ92_12775 [Leptospira biflexa]
MLLKSNITRYLSIFALFLNCQFKNSDYLITVPYIEKEKNESLNVDSYGIKVIGRSCRNTFWLGNPTYNEALMDAIKDYPNASGLSDVLISEKFIYAESFITIFFPNHCIIVEGYPSLLKR